MHPATRFHRRFTFGAPAVLLALAACASSPSDAGDPLASDPSCDLPAAVGPAVLLDDVTVLSYERGAPEHGRAVLVVDGRIHAVGAAGSLAAEADARGATRVPGCGRWLVPGLADMHVHLRRADLPAYTAAGVTSVRNLWGFPDLLAMRDEIEAGELAGPTIHVISSGLDGPPEKWPYTQFVLNEADAARVVAEQAALGYRTLKLYSDLSRPAFNAVVAEARQRGLAYGGHVPQRVGLGHALASGYRFIEHMSGYETVLNGRGQLGAFGWRNVDRGAMPALAAETAAAGTWNCPTLAIFSMIASGDQEVVANRRAMVAALHAARAPLLVGTDAGIGRTEPGSSLHDEMAEFVAAGIAPLEVLRMTTVGAARFLGVENSVGRIAPGYRADLLLVDGDPLANLDVLRRPRMVLARGARLH